MADPMEAVLEMLRKMGIDVHGMDAAGQTALVDDVRGFVALRVAAPTTTATSWRSVFQDIQQRLCGRAGTESEHHRSHRRSLTPRSGVKLPPVDLGSQFTFMNRDSECEQLLKLFECQEEVRDRAAKLDADDHWETLKREIVLPVCIGISGIGKSTFARVGAYHALRRRDAAAGPPHHNQAAVAAAVRESEASGLNFRVNCEDLNKCARPEVETHAAYHLLYEYIRGDLQAATSFPKFMHMMGQAARGLPQLSIVDAMELIARECPTAAILVNIDEAQEIVSEQRLIEVLRGFGKALLHGHRVYFTVTGLQKYDVLSATFASGMKIETVVLPPLEEVHMEQIVNQLLPLDGALLNHHFRHLCWFVGGVPRLLAYVLEELAKFGGACEKSETEAWINRKMLAQLVRDMDENTMADIRRRVCGHALRRTFYDAVPADACHAVVALAVTGTSVARETVITRTGAKIWTVQDAAEEQIVYLREGGGKKCSLWVPPVYLYCMHSFSVTVDNPRLPLLLGAAPTGTRRDNETLLATTMLLRMQVAAVLGGKDISLAELGLVPGRSALSRKRVRLPQCFALHRVPETVTSENFDLFVATKRAEMASSPMTTPCMWVNMPTAKFADAFALLTDAKTDEPMTILVQEKQSVTARRKVITAELDRSKAGAGPTVTAIHEELNKVHPVFKPANGLFVYVSDCGAHRLPRVPRGVRIITSEQHDYVFGTILSRLRLFVVAESDIDLARNNEAYAEEGGGADGIDPDWEYSDEEEV